MKVIVTKNFIRISKCEAKKRFENGEVVFATPHKLDPENRFNPALALPHNYTFDAIVAHATWYTCRDNETGKYLAFYRKYT